MTWRTLELGGLVLPVYAGLSLDQRYAPLSGRATRRTVGGNAVRRTHWAGKLRTTITGSGSIPLGLGELDYSVSMLLKCAASRAVLGATTTITIPAARRTDSGYAPAGYGSVNDRWVATAMTITDNVATLTAVTGAIQYRVLYWPELTVFADEPQEDHSVRAAEVSWTLEAEEV